MDRVRLDAAVKEVSDEELVVLAQSDRAAFGVLYDRYLGSIYRYCYGRLGDHDQAEDATSLIFARALAALQTQRGPSVRSWLFAIAHNVVLNARRDLHHDRSLDDAFDLADPSPDPQQLAEASERRSSVANAVAQLPDEQRRVVELRLAGLTGPEIADVIGRSHDSVRTTQRRALAQMRLILRINPTREEGRRDF